MRAHPFVKYEGLGNDFIIVDERSAASGSYLTAERAVRLCDRRLGIGADGVLSLRAASTADAKLVIFNADGSVPEMCGNGLRCVVRYLHRATKKDTFTIETGAGLLQGRLDASDIEAELGPTRVTHPRFEVDLDGQSHSALGVSVGNPHLVLAPFSPGTDLRALAEQFGPRLERHANFPDRTNVEFLSVREGGGVDLVVFERGAGLTQACGTGAAAAARALREFEPSTTPRLSIHLPGGRLDVILEARNGEMFASIAGPARRAFEGTFHIEDYQ